MEPACVNRARIQFSRDIGFDIHCVTKVWSICCRQNSQKALMDKAIFVGKEGMVKEENQGSLAMTPIRETQAEKGALLTVPKRRQLHPLPKRTEKKLEEEVNSLESIINYTVQSCMNDIDIDNYYACCVQQPPHHCQLPSQSISSTSLSTTTKRTSNIPYSLDSAKQLGGNSCVFSSK